MARPGYALAVKAGGGGQVKTIMIQLAGLVANAFGALTMTWLMPERGRIIGVTFDAAALGGTHSTSTIDVSAVATSLLDALIDVAAHTPATPVHVEGTALSATAEDVAKDTQMRVVLAESGGSTPLIQGSLLQIDYVPLGD